MNQFPSSIKLSQLRAFVAVAECGNFGEAAWKLGLTQPTVSHAIATLENELGVILLTRGRQGTHLTPAGTQVIGHIREILRLLDVVVQEANVHKGLQGGQVRIATFRSAAAHLLPPVIARFQADFPAVKVTLIEHYDAPFVEQDLRDGKADIGFTFLPTAADLETVEILQEDYIVLLPPHLAEPFGESEAPLTWQQLIDLPLILYPNDNSCFIAVQRHFSAAGYTLKPCYQFRETSTILNMVAQGMGAAVLPQLSAIALPNGIQVRALPTPLQRRIGAAVLANSLQTPAVFMFLGCLHERVSA